MLNKVRFCVPNMLLYKHLFNLIAKPK